MNQITIGPNLNVDNIMEDSIKAVQTGYKESIKITWPMLRAAAVRFLSDIAKLNREAHRQQSMLLTIPDSDSAFLSTPIWSKHEFMKQKYKLAFAFDDKVTQFRKLAPKQAIFVYYSHNRIASYVLPLESLINLVDPRTGQMTGVTISQLQAEGGQKIEEAKNDFPNQEHIKHVKAAYLGVKNRIWQFTKRAKDAKMQANTDNTALLMWKEQGRFWRVATVTGYGDAKEAYVNALLQKHENDLLCSNPIGTPDFYDHGLIRDFFLGFIQQVGPTPAVVEEDVITENGQYAVKGDRASLPGLDQYLQVARLIASMDPVGVTGEQLDAKIREKYKSLIEAKAKNTVIGTVQDITNKELGPIVQDVQKQEFLIDIYT